MHKETDIWFIDRPQWDDAAGRTDYITTDDIRQSDPIYYCTTCGRAISAMRWEPPFELEYEAKGSELSDIANLWGVTGDLIVSENALDYLRKYKYTGFIIRGEAKIVKGKPKRLLQNDHHRRFVLETWPVPIRIDEKASKMIRPVPVICFVCCGGTAGYGPIIFERPFKIPVPDIFRPYNLPGSTCVSNRFKTLCDENNFKGIQFIHPLDYSRSDPTALDVWDHLVYMDHLDDPEEYLRKERAWLADKKKNPPPTP